MFNTMDQAAGMAPSSASSDAQTDPATVDLYKRMIEQLTADGMSSLAAQVARQANTKLGIGLPVPNEGLSGISTGPTVDRP